MNHETQPCLCLCFALVQMTRTTPRRRTTLHLSQIRLTDALTFMLSYAFRLCLPDDPATCPVSGRQLHNHSITDEQPHEVPLDVAGRMRRDPMLSLDLHLVEATRQLCENDTLYSTRLVRHLTCAPGLPRPRAALPPATAAPALPRTPGA